MKRYFNNKNVWNCNTVERYASGFPIDINGKEKIINLSGEWLFKFFDNSKNVPEDFGREEFDYSDFDKIKVPLEWQIAGIDTPIYTNIIYPKAINTTDFIRMPRVYEEKVSCGLYVKEFDIESIDVKDDMYINFAGVNPCCEVYLNGQFIGYSEDSFDFQEYDISKFVREGKNILMCAVFRYCTGSYLEDQDMWRLSGIFRDVYLINKPKREIFDIFATSTFSDNDYSKCKFNISVTIKGLEKRHRIKILVKSFEDDSILIERNEEVGDNENKFSYDVEGFKLWSHEIPNLYEIIVTLLDEDTILDCRKTNFGFREVKIVKYDEETQRGPFILLNGKPLKFRGVNRHEFHPDYGHAVPVELIESDIKLCKENNITAIRTSHYPNNKEFYNLCDKYGILVMCENNLETHGLSFAIPKNSKYWTKQVVYRVRNMVNTFKNHPCIVSWSLGNESGCGEAFREMKKEILLIDKTRFIHYEEDITGEISDVFSEMYGPQEKMAKIGENKKVRHCMTTVFKPLGVVYKPKMYVNLPYMQCEYAHCMGNSLGNFSDYWSDFKKYDRLAGGFIWDFADQAIKYENKETGKIEYRFGGDFGDKPNDGVFAFNGIVRADRSPNPALYEVKKEYQMVDFTLKNDVIKVINKYMFLNMENFKYKVDLIIEGETSKSLEGIITSLKPNEVFDIDISSMILDLDEEKENSLICSVINSKSDNIVAYNQFILNEKDLSFTIQEDSPLQYDDEDFRLKIVSKNTNITIDKLTGFITSMKYNSKELLLSPIRPNFIRPTIDNDRFAQVNMDFVKTIMGVYKFHKAKFTPKRIDVSGDDSTVTVVIDWNYKYGKLQTIYFVNDGKVKIQMSITPNTNLIRYGFTFETIKEFQNIQFFANGPFENYCDRKSAAISKIYKGKPDEFCHQYLSPQENGNHTYTKYFDIISDIDDLNIKVSAVNKPVEFTCIPYSLDTLEKCTHAHEVEKADHMYVYVDGKQRGVGGDIPAIASLKPPYKINKGEKYEFEFVIEISKQKIGADKEIVKEVEKDE
ncbi:MAG: hypothetical protein K5765_09110 [Clostridia bacterium]|nr:hypothetical protein [Clostridia bacterium]